MNKEEKGGGRREGGRREEGGREEGKSVFCWGKSSRVEKK